MPTAPNIPDLLEYNEKHRVLICRECKYGIQKNALGSHLLRHKIYRGERQHLLSSIACLELLDPDLVQLPPSGSPPVDGLPIISGYRCTTAGCESLYASVKRMRRHWSESHGVRNPPNSFAHPVNLQTFFRGTKLRYFEVASPGPSPIGRLLATTDRTPERLHGPDATTALGIHAQCAVSMDAPYSLDLETLRYFHHFTTTTSLTLPVAHHEPANYWQTDVVAQSLKLSWLMCGLLDLSACHLAANANDERIKRVHLQRSTRFLQDFSAGWEEAKLNPASADFEEARKTGAQMICIQRCFQWSSALRASGSSPILEPPPFHLRSFIMAIQGCIDANCALYSAANDHSMPEDILDQANRGLGEISDAGVPSNIPSAILERLRAIPYRMTESLGKPDSALDFFATLSAINALVECCSLSYASDDMKMGWAGMTLWLDRISGHFHQMLHRRSSAALVILAHWSLLVERTERHCWFLSGSAAKVLRQIAADLPDDRNIQNLIEGLIS